MSTKNSIIVARAIAVISLCWIAFWEIYLQMGEPSFSFLNFVGTFFSTFVIVAICIGITELIDHSMAREMDDLAVVLFLMVFPFMLLSMNVVGSWLTNDVEQAAQAIHSELKEKTQDEQFHLVDYVRNLLN